MRDIFYGTSSKGDRRVLRPAVMGFQAESDYEPPAPSQMFARLGLLLVIALGFGLIAQLLVGVPA